MSEDRQGPNLLAVLILLVLAVLAVVLAFFGVPIVDYLVGLVSEG